VDLRLRWTISETSSGELPCSIAANDLQIGGELHWVFESAGSYAVHLWLFAEDRPVSENQYVLTVTAQNRAFSID